MALSSLDSSSEWKDETLLRLEGGAELEPEARLAGVEEGDARGRAAPERSKVVLTIQSLG